MSEMKKNERPFASYEITFRNPHSFHLFHEDEGITKTMVIDVLRKAKEYKVDPRKLRKKIRLFNITEHLTEHIRLTVIFQIFPREKRLHVINAYLGSFHSKNLYERMGLKGDQEKETRKT